MKIKNSRIFKGSIAITIIFSMLTTIAIGMNVSSENDFDNSKTNQIPFYATIEFTLYEGEGCSCDELQDILIFADGQDNDHDVGAYTDDRGYCYLELEIDSTYRISIQDENYQNVLFDVLIVDDQEFIFHLTKDEVSVPQEITVSNSIIKQPQLISK